jgi:excisionase family DNA binding protein
VTERNLTDEMLTVREVAHRLHVHPSTLRRWSNQGLITAYRITPRGDRRYKLQTVTIFLDEMHTNKGNVKKAGDPKDNNTTVREQGQFL